MTDQERINREFTHAIAANTSATEKVVKEVEVLQEKIDDSVHGLRNHLHMQGIQLTRIDTQLTKLEQIEEDLYGNGTVRGMIGRVSRLEEIEGNAKTDLVTRSEFEPIKKLVYGIVGLTLAAVVTAILSLVIKQ